MSTLTPFASRIRFTAILLFALSSMLVLSPLHANLHAQDDEGKTPTTAEIAQTYDFTAGAPRITAYLAPDGEQFVYMTPGELCLYTIDGEEQECMTLPDEARQLDLESLSWSYDSRYVAYALNASLYFIDSDIWVYDTVENTLTNVTPDEVEGVDFDALQSGDAEVDLSPRWTEDGRLWFLRSNLGDTRTVFSMDLESGELNEVYQYLPERTGQYSMMDVSADGSLIVLMGGNPGDEKSVVIYDGETENVIPLPEEFSARAMALSPDHQSLLIMDDYGLSQFENGLWVLDLASSELTPVDADRITQAAGWLPDQNGLVYLARDNETDTYGLYITDASGESGSLLLEGAFWGSDGFIQPITVSPSNNLLLNYSDGSIESEVSAGYVLAEVTLE